jgi:hypothetical protein
MIAPRIAWLACSFQDQVILGSSSQVIADGKPGLSPADYDRVGGDGYGFAHNAAPSKVRRDKTGAMPLRMEQVA